MAFTLDEVRALIQDVENSSLREFNLEEDGFSLHLSKNENAPVVAASSVAPASTTAVAAPANNESAPVKAAHPLDQADNTVTINAPLVGTAYLRPNPDAKPFKQVGDRVVVGEQVAIVEAMKLMTPVKSEVAGVITEVLVEEEQVVDFDKPMFRVELEA